MRGYGTLQTMPALEVLIDEAATALKLDPIAFRRRNALKQDGRTMAGELARWNTVLGVLQGLPASAIGVFFARR